MNYINQNATKSYAKLSGEFRLLFICLNDLSDVKWLIFIFGDYLQT